MGGRLNIQLKPVSGAIREMAAARSLEYLEENQMHKSWSVAMAAIAALLTAPVASWASAAIDVSLFDKGTAAGMPTGFGYGTSHMDMSKATMWMKLSSDSAKAGTVTFKVINNSKDMVHELLVIPLKDPAAPVPFDDKTNRIDEGKAGSMGEVSDLDPGKSGSLTVTLKPGKYLLVCNQPGHFNAGMWKEFDVTD